MKSQIAKLNDAFRKRLAGTGSLVLTAGIAALPISAQQEIFHQVQTFDTFEEANDPYGDHDFGSFDHAGQTILWKIDCCDVKLKWASPDPANPAVTRRVLTIMLAEEY
jgi:hypothetical protein